jgi:hypothetical protein
MSTIYTFQNETNLAAGSVAADDVLLIYDTSAGRTKQALVSAVVGGQAPTSLTAGATLTAAAGAGRLNVLNAAAGQAIVLPAASGTGNEYAFIVGTTITSNSTTIKVANSSDTMKGFCISSQDAGATLQMFEASGTDDTITMDGSTRGGIVGDRISLVDIATNVWAVQFIASASGTEVTPFSATV